LKISDIDTPLFAVGCETDHIASWKDSFYVIKQMESRSKTFLLSQSGHVAGIINPPVRKKYGYYVNSNLCQNIVEWKAGAEFVKESWWPFWSSWLVERSGRCSLLRQLGAQVLNQFAMCLDYMYRSKLYVTTNNIAATQKNTCNAASQHTRRLIEIE
jgi:polyhydroxyalkanoate synthase